MIEFPFKYVGALDIQWEILGWSGNFLQTRRVGTDRINTLDKANTEMLLKAFNLPDQRKTGSFRNWEEEPED